MLITRDNKALSHDEPSQRLAPAVAPIHLGQGG